MDWSSFLTVVATGGVTLAGVWLNGRYADRGEQRRIAADQARLTSEIKREADELQRREQSDAWERNEVTEARARDLAHEIAETFLGELRNVREFQETDDSGFAAWYETKWSTETDIELRRLIGQVREDDERARVTQVVDALDMFDGLADWGFDMRKPLVERLLTLGFDISAAVARGQQLDDGLSEKLAMLANDMSEWVSYQEQQRNLRMEQWRAESDARKAAKAVGLE